MAAYSSRAYLTVAALAVYLGYGGTPVGMRNAARAWVTRTGVRKYWRGKAWVVHPDDVDRMLAGEVSHG